MTDTEIKLNRNVVKISRKNDNDDGYIDADPAMLFSMVWDITCDLWAFSGRNDAERRLQRNVVNIIRRES